MKYLNLIAILAATGTSLATAQDETAPESEDESTTELDALTVTVTAQSREQELQDVPIALQVVDDRLLEDVVAEDLGDIDSYVPGLSVNDVQPTQPRISLRGISTDDFGIGTDAAVGVYVDGVYSGRSGGILLPFTDVERIEVLKGPQGTLFGRNTAAGAVSIITRRPSFQTEARTKLRLGNHNKRYVETMANLPLGDKSALRFNALYNDGGGWLRDGDTGRRLNDDDLWAARAAWRLDLGDFTTALITWNHEKLDQRARPSTGIVPLPAAPGVPAVPADESDWLDPRKVTTFNDTDDNESRTFDGVTLIVDHDFNWGNLTSTTAWRKFDTLNRAEEDGTNRPELQLDSANTERNKSLYQEFKFSASSDRFDWVAGLSYFREDANQTSEINTTTTMVDTAALNLGLAPTPDGTLYGFLTRVVQAFGVPVSLLGHDWNETFENSLDTHAYAAFGDVIWHANDRFNLTFGLRYTRDKKDFTWFNDLRSAPTLDAALDEIDATDLFEFLGIAKEELIFDLAFTDPPAEANKGVLNRSSNRWSDWSPRLVADYHINPDTMLFASLAKGYKAGGFNALQIGSEFENEEVWNLETGIKQSLFDRRLQYNASLFYYRYDDRQAIHLENNPDLDIPRFVVNTSDLDAWGMDFDARWQVTGALGMDLNFSFIDSQFRKFTTTEGQVLNGQPTGEPYLSAAAGIDYRFDLGTPGDFRLALRHSYRGRRRCNDASVSQNQCNINPVLDLGESQQRTDVRVAWSSPQGYWNWAIYGKNVFDNQYVTGLHTFGKDVLGTVGASISEPRQYGLELNVRF